LKIVADENVLHFIGRPDADEFVFDLARRYTADYTVITRRYHRYSSSVCSKEKLCGDEAAFLQEYEVDIEDAQEDGSEVRWLSDHSVNDYMISHMIVLLTICHMIVLSTICHMIVLLTIVLSTISQILSFGQSFCYQFLLRLPLLNNKVLLFFRMVSTSGNIVTHVKDDIKTFDRPSFVLLFMLRLILKHLTDLRLYCYSC
jgi:hypothetical protein